MCSQLCGCQQGEGEHWRCIPRLLNSGQWGAHPGAAPPREERQRSAVIHGGPAAVDADEVGKVTFISHCSTTAALCILPVAQGVAFHGFCMKQAPVAGWRECWSAFHLRTEMCRLIYICVHMKSLMSMNSNQIYWKYLFCLASLPLEGSGLDVLSALLSCWSVVFLHHLGCIATLYFILIPYICSILNWNTSQDFWLSIQCSLSYATRVAECPSNSI